MNEYENNLFLNHECCTLENISIGTGEGSFPQCHPFHKMKARSTLSDDIEAFQDSGTPAFRAEEVELMRKGLYTT